MSERKETPDPVTDETLRLLRERYMSQFRAETHNWDEIVDLGIVLDDERVRRALSTVETKHIRTRLAAQITEPAGSEAVVSRVSRWLRMPSHARVRRGQAPVAVDPPALALRLFSREDAAHYAREWRAHLSELVVDGEHRQARRDRRRLALRAPSLALELRVRALVRRRLRSPR